MEYDIKNQSLSMQNLNTNNQIPYMYHTSSMAPSMTSSVQFNNGPCNSNNMMGVFNKNNSMLTSINNGIANNNGNIITNRQPHQPHQYNNFIQKIPKNTQPKN
jgi:hypothetical protein